MPPPISAERLDVEKSRGKLLGALGGSQDITIIRNAGNNGDSLIHAGMRQLLKGETQVKNTGDAGFSVAATEVERLRALADERGRVLDDLLNSKSYRIVSAYWRLRAYLSRR